MITTLFEQFYYYALGAFFDALIQRTDGCIYVPWLLVQTHHSIQHKPVYGRFEIILP